MDIHTALRQIEAEYIKAVEFGANFNSPYEAYAALLAEVDGLWEQTKMKLGHPPGARKEAVQVAATAIRFLVDCC